MTPYLYAFYQFSPMKMCNVHKVDQDFLHHPAYKWKRLIQQIFSLFPN